MKEKRVGSVLNSFKLHYEELEKKKVTKPSKVKAKAQSKNKSFKDRKEILFGKIRVHFNNTVHKMTPHRKKARKLTKAELKFHKEQNVRAILGIGLLLVVVSIAYSTTIIFLGVDSSASRLALLPQVIFALFTLIKAFSKFYK